MTVLDLQAYRDKKQAQQTTLLPERSLRFTFDLLLVQFKLCALAISLSLVAIDMVTENMRRFKGPEPR